MADRKISQLTELDSSNVSANDLIPVIDVSDLTMAPSGTTKKIALSELQAAPLSAGTANGVAFLNASKVLTTGSALTFDGTNFATTGAVTVGTNTRVQASSGILFINGPSSIAFENGAGVENMRLTSTGLGIGTSSPGFTAGTGIHVYRTSGTTLRVQDATTDFDILSFGGNAVLTNRSNGALILGTNNTERARIDSSGNLLVGRTSKFADIGIFGSNIQSNLGLSVTDGTNTSLYNQDRIYFDFSNFYVMNAGAVGVVLATGSTAWAAQSDERTKDIIEPISNALEKTASLRAVIGKYKKDDEGTRRSFLIAQDVQKVLPEAVSKTSNEDDTLILRYTEVIPLLVASIQELKAEFDAYKASHP